eukprot:2275223-Pleurochrysis_carterae.AAC.1
MGDLRSDNVAARVTLNATDMRRAVHLRCVLGVPSGDRGVCAGGDQQHGTVGVATPGERRAPS